MHIDGLTEVVDEARYRAMDALVEVEATVAGEIFATGPLGDLVVRG